MRWRRAVMKLVTWFTPRLSIGCEESYPTSSCNGAPSGIETAGFNELQRVAYGQRTWWQRVQHIIKLEFSFFRHAEYIKLSVNNSNSIFLHAAAKKRLQRTKDFSQTTTNFFKRFLGYLIDPPGKKTHVLVS